MKILIEDQEIHVKVTHYSPYDPGEIFGPPENCYPPEPAEVEWELTDENNEFTQEAIDKIEEWQEDITEQLLEELANQEPEEQ